jgi:hypothetical protein
MMEMVSSAANCVDVVTAGVKVCFVTCEWNVERRLSSSVHCVQYERSTNTASCAMSENMLAAVFLLAVEHVCVCVCVCVSVQAHQVACPVLFTCLSVYRVSLYNLVRIA